MKLSSLQIIVKLTISKLQVQCLYKKKHDRPFHGKLLNYMQINEFTSLITI